MCGKNDRILLHTRRRQLKTANLECNMTKSKAWKLYESLKKKGLLPEQEQKILQELKYKGKHKILGYPPLSHLEASGDLFYYLQELQPYLLNTNPQKYNDLAILQGMKPKQSAHYALQTLDELLERDKQREKDGFPTKIKLGKIVKPGKGKKGKIIVVPVTSEDKFIHDDKFGMGGMGEGEGGTGEGEEGEVIGEQPLQGEGEGEDGEAGQEEGDHSIESKAYELGRILTQRFDLPNLKEKGKKSAVKQYTYDLTDKHRGHGQILDKKATLEEIIETNLGLGNITGNEEEIDTTNLIVSPRDKIYRILSREVQYQSQAIVFLLRDYSGSMYGKPTELVCTQHLFIYAWLLYQYEKLVTPRFIVHDTEAKEVPDFHTYYNLIVAGGTSVYTAFQKVNELVEKENLAKDYNIYVFYGGDGEDWYDGTETVNEIKKMLTYTNRIGMTIINDGYNDSAVEKYMRNSGLLETNESLIRMNSLSQNATEDKIIKSIIDLVSE